MFYCVFAVCLFGVLRYIVVSWWLNLFSRLCLIAISLIDLCGLLLLWYCLHWFACGWAECVGLWLVYWFVWF